MSVECADTEIGDRFVFPAERLLEVALARLKRQAQYSRLLSGGGGRSAALLHWLDQAADCIAALARPEALIVPIAAEIVPGGVRLAGKVTLEGEDLDMDVARGAEVSAYLMTLNYSQSQAFEWMDRDYGAHHVQSDLGSEVLFALGREVKQHLRARCRDGRLRQIPILTSALCGQRRIWEPSSVQALLTVFDGLDSGVSVTDTGCFSPLNSLLGLALCRATG